MDGGSDGGAVVMIESAMVEDVSDVESALASTSLEASGFGSDVGGGAGGGSSLGCVTWSRGGFPFFFEGGEGSSISSPSSSASLDSESDASDSSSAMISLMLVKI